MVLDALCVMGDGSRCCVEVQKADDADHMRRVRYIRSSAEVAFAEKGSGYGELPPVIVVFLSSFDPFTAGLTTYHVDKTVRETGRALDDGTLDVYVNSAVDDGSRAARLMAYMEDPNGTNDEFPRLSGRVSFFKETEEGRARMNELIEEYARECARVSALRTLISNTRCLMETFDLTAAQALDILKMAEPWYSEALAALAAQA